MGCMNQAVVLVLLLSALLSTSKAKDFKCNTTGKCKALVGYVPVNDTTFSDILNLFNIKNLRSVLGANNLPLLTNRSSIVKAKQPVKIPIDCHCTNGTGVSKNGPVYTVKKDDTLYFIASAVFSGLLKYPKIVKANNITNENLIEVGQNLTIPLPCSCDDVDGDKVVHYAHVVLSRSTLQSIAQQFGTDEDTLKKLNDIEDDSDLIADDSIDVPLKACNSSFNSEAFDRGLLAANGTYVFTANGCVKCTCDSTRSLTLQCEQSELNIKSKVEECSSSKMQCIGSGSEPLLIGTSTSDPCNRTACTYAGYNNQSIFTTLNPVDTCPTSTASNIGSSWSFLFISIHLVLLFLRMFQ